MGIAMSEDGNVVMLGNFTEAKRYNTEDGLPDWDDAWERDWKAIIPFPFKWRDKLGKVECDCTECVIAHMPYYGYSWYHMDDCAMHKHFARYPQMANLGYSVGAIAHSE